MTGQQATRPYATCPAFSPARCRRRGSLPVRHAVFLLISTGTHLGQRPASSQGQPGAGQFRDTDRHADAANAVWDCRDGGGDHLSVLVGVTAVLIKVSRSTLKPAKRARCSRTYSRPKPEPSSVYGPEQGSSSCACSTRRPIPAPPARPARVSRVRRRCCPCAPHAHGSIPSKKDICAGRWTLLVGRQLHGPEAMGSSERAPRMCRCQRVNSVAAGAERVPDGQPITIRRRAGSAVAATGPSGSAARRRAQARQSSSPERREIRACGEDVGPSGEVAGAGRVKPCSARSAAVHPGLAVGAGDCWPRSTPSSFCAAVWPRRRCAAVRAARRPQPPRTARRRRVAQSPKLSQDGLEARVT